MKRERFEYLCLETEAGRDAFARNPDSHEEGLITRCDLKSGHLMVQTSGQQTRCWDFRDCEDLQHPKSGPMG